jgi:hypothetical protein
LETQDYGRLQRLRARDAAVFAEAVPLAVGDLAEPVVLQHPESRLVIPRMCPLQDLHPHQPVAARTESEPHHPMWRHSVLNRHQAAAVEVQSIHAQGQHTVRGFHQGDDAPSQVDTEDPARAACRNMASMSKRARVMGS